MLMQNQPHQIKSQSAASGAAVPGTFLPEKCLKKVRQGVFTDMCSGIFHGQERTVFPLLTADPDFRSLRRVEDSIGKQISNRFFQQRSIPCNDDSASSLL